MIMGRVMLVAANIAEIIAENVGTSIYSIL
jgi:hypothetical protein